MYALREMREVEPRGSRPRWPRLVREVGEERADGAVREVAVGREEHRDPDDELYLLGERCAQAYMEADALHYRAMKLLAEFHRQDGWKDTGFSSTAEWLAWRIGIQLHAARERVRTALALETLPLTSAAMEEGELSYSKVRSLTRVATAENEERLLDLARAGSAANLERLVRGWKKLDGKSELTAEQIRHRSRRFSAWVDDDGMVVVRGRLDPEVGAVFMRAVEAAGDALFRRGRGRGREGGSCADGEAGYASDGGEAGCQCHGVEADARVMRQEDPSHDPKAGRASRNTDAASALRQADARAASRDKEAGIPETTPEQRRADAVGLLAERALAAGFGGAGFGAAGFRAVGFGGSAGEGSADGDGAAQAPISGSRAERYQVMLHVDVGTLEEEGEAGQSELSELEDGTRVTAVTSRRISCDAGLVIIGHGTDGQVTGASHRKRTVPPSVRRALEARDRGCRFPGCGLRFTDAHHVKHWADGGETTLRNLVLLCRRHHRAVHEGGVRVCLDRDGQVVFFSPRGKALVGAPPRRLDQIGRNGGMLGTDASDAATCPRTQGPPAGCRKESRPRPPSIRAAAAIPRWKFDRNIPWEVEARAWEALDSG